MLVPLLAAALGGCQPAALAPPADRTVALRAQVPADSVAWMGEAATVLLSLEDMEAAARVHRRGSTSSRFVHALRDTAAQRGAVTFRGPSGTALVADLLDAGKAVVRLRDGSTAPAIRSVRETRHGEVTVEERVFYLPDGRELLRITDTIILP